MIAETSAAVNKKLSLSLSSVGYLPIDLWEEILCRLSVKLLLQFQCVCKPWNSLISHPKFAKKHLSMSTTHHLHFPPLCNKNIITSCPLHQVFTVVPTNNNTQLPYLTNNCKYRIVGSCNGILCLAYKSSIILWNPSIRKSKELPPFQEPYDRPTIPTYSFGYDLVTDNYKVVVIATYPDKLTASFKSEVKVHTVGTNFWKNIQNIPFDGKPPDYKESGKFVSGAINWLASKQWYQGPYFVISLDLGNESYQKLLLPLDDGEIYVIIHLGVLRDCLCMMHGHDIWIMKEYGNKESWTKLFTVSYTQDPNKYYYIYKAIYMFEDEQVLLQSYEDWSYEDGYSRLIVYDPRIGTFKFVKFQSKRKVNLLDEDEADDAPEICIESLISPCS